MFPAKTFQELEDSRDGKSLPNMSQLEFPAFAPPDTRGLCSQFCGSVAVALRILREEVLVKADAVSGLNLRALRHLRQSGTTAYRARARSGSYCNHRPRAWISRATLRAVPE